MLYHESPPSAEEFWKPYKIIIQRQAMLLYDKLFMHILSDSNLVV